MKIKKTDIIAWVIYLTGCVAGYQVAKTCFISINKRYSISNVTYTTGNRALSLGIAATSWIGVVAGGAFLAINGYIGTEPAKW